ncbi:hypothetical protein Desku_2093 [Desulfofundulus kuznetsovii DSM 6115]|uniref:Uncharacterized protein n=1 Tax=Desulfofundulus kuznetsovii (strain DSM 6115 / VKM B-1805 / 17) TaxID=760568 RepID=A0AAU8PWS5_DESK7|nr:hypothetical protein Desku_2093 [Desulfofundulus kuznetsovii DSM 6115]
MKDLLDQIESALDANLYFLALAGSLLIPDICGAAGSKNGRSSREKYINWFAKYASNICPFLSGEDCWRFRCSLLHQGSSQDERSSYCRVLFIEPTATTNVFHCNVLNDALNIDIRIFCLGMVAAARRWLGEVEGTELFKRNMRKFMQRYPNGLAPYIVGVPVIS